MFKRHNEHIKPETPSPLETMEAASFPVICLPFNGTQVLCKVRCLNYLQLKAAGDFSLIDISQATDKKEADINDIIDMRNWQEAIIRETLISPTLDEILLFVYNKDNVISTYRERVRKLSYDVKHLTGDERQALEKEIQALEIFVGCLLPDDFMNAVTAWATGTDRTDIKKLTRDMLLEAAVLAKNGGDNPSEHVSGNFLDWHKIEIDKAAWIVYNDFMREKEIEKESARGGRIIRGGKVTR